MESPAPAAIPEPANCIRSVEYRRLDAGHGRDMAHDVIDALTVADRIDANGRELARVAGRIAGRRNG